MAQCSQVLHVPFTAPMAAPLLPIIKTCGKQWHCHYEGISISVNTILICDNYLPYQNCIYIYEILKGIYNTTSIKQVQIQIWYFRYHSLHIP